MLFLGIYSESYTASLRLRQNWRHFADDNFKYIFLNENVWIPIRISLKFVPKGPINNIPALVQIMAWRRPGDKPLSEPMMVSLSMHICVARSHWVNSLSPSDTIMEACNLVNVGSANSLLQNHYLNQCWPIVTRDQFWPSILSLLAFVHVSVNHKLVCAITHKLL